MTPRKVVVCGAGFLGKHIAKNLAASFVNSSAKVREVQISSRHPDKLCDALKSEISSKNCLLSAIPVDITQPDTLGPAFNGADIVVSLVGIMHGSVQDFERVQWKGAENVAVAAKQTGAKLIHFSAIGADATSNIVYARTKGLGEAAVVSVNPDATIIRPSLVFGPEDDFFNRFARLSKYLPFLPVFGGGRSQFQPVYVGDLGKLIEIMCRGNATVDSEISGKVLEAGGPEVFTYRDLMGLVLKYSARYRPIISVPFSIGLLQGVMLERLPVNLFTVTRDQVKQLKYDNIVNENPGPNHLSFKEFFEKHTAQPLTSAHDVLPTYLC